MEFLIQQTKQHSPEIILALLLALCALTGMVVVQMLSARKLARRMDLMLRGSNGTSIESMLREHLDERSKLDARTSELEGRIGTVEKKVRSAIRYVGVVRYDAFEDTGGQQSFSMAMYDEDGNGSLLTSLYGQMDCRVFGKALEGGKSDRSLTREEQKAVEIAGSPRQAVRMK